MWRFFFSSLGLLGYSIVCFLHRHDLALFFAYLMVLTAAVWNHWLVEKEDHASRKTD